MYMYNHVHARALDRPLQRGRPLSRPLRFIVLERRPALLQWHVPEAVQVLQVIPKLRTFRNLEAQYLKFYEGLQRSWSIWMTWRRAERLPSQLQMENWPMMRWRPTNTHATTLWHYYFSASRGGRQTQNEPRALLLWSKPENKARTWKSMGRTTQNNSKVFSVHDACTG